MLKFIFSSLLLAFSTALYGIGSLQLGANLGVYPNINGLAANYLPDGGDNAAGIPRGSHSRRDSIDMYDSIIKRANEETNISGKAAGYPIAATYGVELRYLWNNLFFRLGADYSTQVTAKKASLKTTTYDNSISYQSWAMSVPLTIGLSNELKDFFHFYMGIGPYYSYAHINVKHSAPQAFSETFLGAGSSYIPYEDISIGGDVVGLHFLVGIQIPVIDDKLFVSFDIMHIEARSGSLDVNGKDENGNAINDTTGSTIEQNGEKYLFGVQYKLGI